MYDALCTNNDADCERVHNLRTYFDKFAGCIGRDKSPPPMSLRSLSQNSEDKSSLFQAKMQCVYTKTQCDANLSGLLTTL